MTMRKSKMNISKKEVIDTFYKAYKDKKKDIYKKIADVFNTAKRREVSVGSSFYPRAGLGMGSMLGVFHKREFFP